MVNEYAMGTRADLAPARPPTATSASEATRALRDQEQRRWPRRRSAPRYELLSTHRALLDELATTLLRDEVIERATIERIVGDTPRAQRPSGAHLRVAATQPPPPEPPRRAVDRAPSGALGGGAARNTLPAVFGRIDHVGVAVEDIDAALPLYRDALRLELVHRETVEEQGVDAALLDVGDGHVELIAPLGPETAVGKFLATRGPGLHHVAYAVDDIEQALDAVREAGLRLIDERRASGYATLG